MRRTGRSYAAQPARRQGRRRGRHHSGCRRGDFRDRGRAFPARRADHPRAGHAGAADRADRAGADTARERRMRLNACRDEMNPPGSPQSVARRGNGLPSGHRCGNIRHCRPAVRPFACRVELCNTADIRLVPVREAHSQGIGWSAAVVLRGRTVRLRRLRELCPRHSHDRKPVDPRLGVATGRG
jgi:hypothetical protein